VDAVDWLKSESGLGKTSYGAMLENAGGNDTVPTSVWRANVVGATSNEGFLFNPEIRENR